MFGFLKGMRVPHRHSQSRQSSPASTASPAEREGEDGSSRSRSGRGGGGGARLSFTQEGAAASTPREEGRELGESVSASRHRAAASPPLSQPAQQQQLLAEKAPSQLPTALSPSSSRLRPHRSASRRSVERLLSHYPAVGSPAERAAAEAAAEEEEEDERQGRDAAYATAASPAQYEARVKRQSLFESHRSAPNGAAAAAVAVADSPQRTSTASARHTAKRGKANMSPTNPLFVSEDEVFTRYLRRVNPSTHSEGAVGGAREKETSPRHRHRHRHRSHSKQPRDSAQTHNGSSVETSLLVGQDDTRVDDGDRSGMERRKAKAHSRAASSPSKRIGAVAYTSSSSSSSTDGDDNGSGGENGGRRVVKRSASSQPLVDASAVFKFSPVDRELTVPPQQQHNNKKHTRSSVTSTKGILKSHKASAAVAVEDAESGSSDSSSSTSSLSVQQRVLSPPPPLPSAPPPNYNSSKRQRRHVRPTDSDEDDDNRVLVMTAPEEVYTHHNRNGLSRGGLKSSAERRRSVSRKGEDPSLRTQRPERVLSAPVAREAAMAAVVPPSSFSPSPLEEAEQAWSFMDMAADISNTPHHHHAPAPTPAPMGTRRLHTAWSSYLQHHGQPHLYEPKGSMRDCVHQQQQQQGQGHVAANAGVVGTRRHGNREDADVAATAAAAALHARLMRSEQNVLLLRGSLLMTYTLLAAQGDVAATRRLTAGAAARRWRREVDRYAGWTEATEAREQQQQQLKNNNNYESDSLRSGRGGSDSNDRGGTTPWPGLEARLDAAVRTIAQNSTNQRVDKRTTTPNNKAVASSESGRGQTPPRLLLRETPAHDLGGLPSLWYPPHRSDAVGPVSGVLSVWFSRGEDEDESEEDAAATTSGAEEESVMESAAQLSTYSAGGDAAAVPPRSRSGFRSLFSRASSSSAAAGRGATPTRSPSSAPPPRQAKAAKKKKRSRSASTSSAAGLKGAWRRCFVVADDRDVRVYPAERDYADFADERLLMSVPFTSLAYLIPDFAEAAAALAGDTSEERHASSAAAAAATAMASEPTAVHVCTVTAVGNAVGAAARGGGGGGNGDSAAEASYTYFGFVHRQTPTVERRAAAACAAGPNLIQALRGRLISGSCGAPLRFAASRVESTRSTAATTKRGSSVDLPHPPLLFRTQSRLAHAEWVHFFAYKFNRHLYQLLFPTTAAAMAGVGLRSAATQTTPETQRLPDVGDVAVVVAKEARDAPVEARRRHRRRHSRYRSRSSSSRHRRDGDTHSADSDAESEENARSRRADTSPSRSSASAPPSPPDITNQFARALPHTQATTAAAAAAAEDTASPMLMQAMTALRHALEERDAQVRSLEAEQAALTKSLRMRERQVHDLQREQLAQQERLTDVLAQLECQKSVAHSQQKEVQRLRASADSAPPRASSDHHHHHQHHHDGDAELVEALEEMAAAHTRESARLHEQLTILQRRYTADQAAWRAEQQTLERRCQLTEVQVQNLRDGAAHEVRSLARQVVRDLDDFHSEVTQGTERCVASMIDGSERANQRRLQAPANLCESEAGSTFPPGNAAVVPASAALALGERDGAGAARSIPIASLLLTYADGNGAVVDGELVVDEAAASVLLSGPTANQRGRRWELRHHVTDALLRIQLELLSRAPGDRRMSPSASPVAVLHGTPRQSRSGSRATTPLQTPSQLSTLLQQQQQQQRRLRASSEERPRALCQAERRRDAAAAAAAERPLLSAVLRAANAAPRDTRASRLRQAAIERQIQEREELDEA